MNIENNRFYKLLHGLRQPANTREYKEARIELERLSAPLVALLVPSLVAAVLLVVTAMGTVEPSKLIDIVAAVPDDPITFSDPPPPPVNEPAPEPTITDIPTDIPSVPTPEVPPIPTPDTNPTPANPIKGIEAVVVKSPISIRMPAGFGVRNGTDRRRGMGSGTGGSDATEQAVMKALRWLKLKQQTDGSWSGVPAAATGFAILTYLAHGETTKSPEFGETVRRGLEWLINAVHEKDGTTRIAGCDGNEYAFLIATYALCEAYGMTRNPNAAEAAEKGLVRIIAGQTATGGWNYRLAKTTTAAPDDISFGGWAMQALKAGKMAGLHPSGMDECIKKAVKCLKTRNFDREAGFVYRPGSRGGGLGGVGCLCLQLLGHAKDPAVANALEVMRDWQPTFDRKHMSGGACSQYYSYYATQCKYQAGMVKTASSVNVKRWLQWNAKMKALYPKTIIDDKRADGAPVTVKDWQGKDKSVGHWENTDVHTMRPVMDTCLCALQLMVYYRYLPTTSLKATEVETDITVLNDSHDVKVQIDI